MKSNYIIFLYKETPIFKNKKRKILDINQNIGLFQKFYFDISI